MFATPLLAIALVIQAQDEIRVSSRAYVPALRVDTRLVEIPAVVRDGHGRAISGLTKDDFRVLDDGKARLIDHFVVENTLHDALNDHKIATSEEPLKTGLPVATPRFLALFIDDVNAKDLAHAGDLKRTQVAAEKFVKEALRTDVRIGIFTASGKPTLDFTTDEVKLLEAIAALRPHMRMSEDGISSYCPWIPPYLAYRIVYDNDRSAMAVVLADAAWKGKQYNNCSAVTPAVVRMLSEETWRRVKEITTDTLDTIGRVVDHLGAMPGKRELLIASSGFIAVSMQDQKDKIIDRALRAGVMISALDSKGLFVDAPADPMRKVEFEYKMSETAFWVHTLNEPLANFAEATGGVFYHNNNDLAAGFRELGGEPEVTYHLGFRPEGVAPDGRFRKLKVSLIHQKAYYSMEARPGYFANSEESLQSKIDREILAEDTQTGFPVGIAVQRVKDGISVIVAVDISKLRFAKQGDRQVQKIAFTTALFDAQGKMAAAKEGLMDLSLTEATYKRLASTGVNAKLTFQIPEGSYKLRQVAEDGDGKIACSSHAIQVR